MIRKILLATDFTSASGAAEGLALELASTVGASVLLLHAIEPIDPGGDDDPFGAFYEGLRAAAAGKLASIRTRFAAAAVPCDTLILLEERWQAILHTAEREGVDLIVMGSRPPLRQGRVAIGSTSHKVFLGTRVPLLVVRAAVEEAPRAS